MITMLFIKIEAIIAWIAHLQNSFQWHLCAVTEDWVDYLVDHFIVTEEIYQITDFGQTYYTNLTHPTTYEWQVLSSDWSEHRSHAESSLKTCFCY